MSALVSKCKAPQQSQTEAHNNVLTLLIITRRILLLQSCQASKYAIITHRQPKNNKKQG